MDALTLQSRIDSGYEKAALRLGLDYAIARPIDAADPLGNYVATIKAAFVKDMNYTRTSRYGDPTSLGLFSTEITLPGDYLLGQAIYFIASQPLHQHTLVVACNRAVMLSRPAQNAGTGGAVVGALGYSGLCVTEGVPALGSAGAGSVPAKLWPASILLGGRTDNSALGLPGSSKLAGWQILLPSSVTETLSSGDVLTDDIGRRYLIQGSELSELGWRLTCTEQHI